MTLVCLVHIVCLSFVVRALVQFVYCYNFVQVAKPTTVSIPAPVSLGTLGFTPYRVHNVFADEVIVLNTRQIQLVNLDYDGNGPGNNKLALIFHS